MSDKRHLSSLKRGLAALSILNLESRLSASELARKIKVPRTTAHRILDTLVSEGYVIHDVHSRSYHLAGQVRRLAHGFNRDSLVAEVARPILRNLCKDVLTPVGLATPDRGDVVIQVSMDYESPLALERLPEGSSFPLTYGPSGHLVLAHCDDDSRAELIEAASHSPSARRLYPATPPNDSDLERIRRDGFALSVSHDPGSPEGIIAIPIYARGAFVASLHLRFMKRVYSPTAAINRYLARMRIAAADIESALALRLLEDPGLSRAISGPLLLSKGVIEGSVAISAG